MRYVCAYARPSVLHLFLVAAGTVLATLSVPCTQAQSQDAGGQHIVNELTSSFEAGHHALQSDQWAQAESLFKAVVNKQSGYISPQHGAAAYWLGHVYTQQEKADKARAAWNIGQKAMRAQGTFDLRLADAYLRATPQPELGYDRAATVDVYRQLLRYADSSLTRSEAAIIKRHAAQAALLMTEEERAGVSSNAPQDTSWTLNDGAGTFLIEWWRQQDPAPATPENERLEEHIQRVAHAQAEYPHATRTSGLDDRGETYVRFGPPYLERSITYNDAGFVLDVFRFGVNVSSFEFPKNEIWTYPQIHHAAYFIFVEDDDHYYIGSSSDLIPRRLSNTFSNSDRHLNRAVSALAAMRYIFRDLALYHSDFGTLYNDIDNYASWQEMNATQFRATGRAPAGTTVRTVGAGIGQERLVFSSPSLGIGTPSQFVQRTAMEQKTLDYHAERIRTKELPPQTTAIFDDVESLSLTMRTARFLEPNGATRTEVYWGTLASNLTLDEEYADKSSLVKLTAVEYAPNYDRRRTRGKWYDTGPAASQQGLVVPNTFSIKSASDIYHLGLQWEQYSADLSGNRIQLDDQLRVTTRRLDTLAALNATPSQLEMSDLKPLLPNGSDEALTAASLETASPYPFDRIGPEASLLLYFEIYHLGFDSDDRTRYAVEYDVTRRTERGRLTRLFRGDEEESTTASTTYEGDSRTAKEQILIDLSDWENEKPGALTVTVRITDEVTGQQVERAIDFEIVPRQPDS